MASRREEVLNAVKALIAAALPGAKVERNAAKPERIPSGGLVIIRDGDPGDPEVTLSPLTYIYTHRIPIEIAVLAAAPLTREQTLDATLIAIGEAVEADRTLGGLCDFLEPEAPSTGDLEATGAVAGRWADAVILATYATPNPLT
ncbi:MAG TPA: hypothetical protein VHA70_14005 [Bauldia sp.]|jgi:hypothetical protein|nr:hypothetical protein [Bauldia sp.]